MRVLVVNTGSSSLKLRLLAADDTVVAERNLESWAGDSADVASWLAGIGAVDAVGHRVVHGGAELRDAVVVDDGVEARIEAQTSLAPLHQPRALAAIRVVRKLLPEAPSVACFDTAYHATMPDAAATYALPEDWRRRWGLRRFGFHGLSHAYAARRAAAMLERPAGQLRVVSCHLGAGASLCASAGGRSVDTTMGFTPLEGLVMATRSGSVDPGLLLWLAEHAGLSVREISAGLFRRSGLAGLGGGTGDLREVLAARRTGDERAELAFDVYIHRLVGEVARMTAAPGGLDALVFTGAIGERSAPVREEVVRRLGFLGLGLDVVRNATADGDENISASAADCATLVVSAREDLEIARQVRALLAGRPPGQR
jgi:acetate kinase